MARPKRDLFYEREENAELYLTHEWLSAYDRNSRNIVDYLVQRDAGTTLYYCTIRCLEMFRRFLMESGHCYTAEAAIQWFRDTGPHPKGYLSALLRLDDFYHYGDIQPINAFPVVVPHYARLCEPWKSLLDNYLLTLDQKERSLTQVRNCIARFLYSIQSSGITKPSEITFQVLESYIKEDAHKSRNSDARYTYAIGDILLFMASRGMCNHGLGWYPYFRMHGNVLLMQDLSPEQICRIESLRNESQTFPSEEYAELIPGFLERFHSLGYSGTPCQVAKSTLNHLLLFLEMHGLGYHREIASVCLEPEILVSKGTGWKQKRRILNLFELYTKEGDVIPQVIFRNRPFRCNSLPDWCRKTLEDFLALKTKEGWESSTLSMYRSSATRFCLFLVEHHINSFDGITVEFIKEFNQTDQHMTIEGKNAYNVRIRSFLHFLERRALIPYGISFSLACTIAPKENVVITLSEDEKAEIEQAGKQASTPTELRSHAILLLGLKIGLRSSDIVKLTLQDINWKRQTIRVMQQKTRHEIELPMPTDVGNAIYLYLKNGRPETACRFVFVKVRAPYDSLSPNACHYALTHSSTQTTRKSYASPSVEMLRREMEKSDRPDAKAAETPLWTNDEELARLCGVR
ncbi:MAG: tyrosine-type recombinase/integrase [Clostridiales bacterium]|nr:tyrosine-type recombinase/integrase [Clostridiales bacterium]